MGPLCGICRVRTYQSESVDQPRCPPCSGREIRKLAIVTSLVVVALLLIGNILLASPRNLLFRGLAEPVAWVQDNFDLGKAKVLWVTLQIMTSVTWSVGIDWPVRLSV